MSDPELLDCEGDFHGAGRLRAPVAYDDGNVSGFRLGYAAVLHHLSGGAGRFKESGGGFNRSTPSWSSTVTPLVQTSK